MAETEKKHALREEPTGISSGFHEWHPFDTLRHQINKLFDELPFRKVFSEFEPFERFATAWAGMPQVELVEKDNEYEITAELPGLVLLCHKVCRWIFRWQHGHRNSRRTKARANLVRMLAIDETTWRSGLIGGSAGSITVG